VSGASLPAYWLSHYIVDICFEAPPSIAAIVAYISFGLDLPMAWTLFVVFIFTNPIFVYFLSTLFEKESTASIMIRIIYIILGVILPFAVIILLIIEDTYYLGLVLRWIFYVFPIYCLDIGVMVLADRSIL